jgi:hypothetical protein
LQPYREENTLTNLGGKHLVLYGGVGRGGDGGGASGAGRELAVVNLDTFTWDPAVGHEGKCSPRHKMRVNSIMLATSSNPFRAFFA